MGQDPGTRGAAMTEVRDRDQIQQDIEQTRQELGDTVEALARKADVKTRARHKLEETKASVSGTKDELIGKARETSPQSATRVASQAAEKARANPVPVVAAAGFLAGFVAARLLRRS